MEVDLSIFRFLQRLGEVLSFGQLADEFSSSARRRRLQNTYGRPGINDMMVRQSSRTIT